MTIRTNTSASHRTAELTLPPTPGPWVLEIGSIASAGILRLSPGDRLILGSGRQADVRVEDPAVSHRHASLTVRTQDVVVEDLGSKNGVYVAGARVTRAALRGVTGTFVLGRTTLALRPARESGAAGEDSAPLDGLIGVSAPMQRLAQAIRRIAGLRCPVLIQGESGTGKDVVAKTIHRESGRRGDLVPINVGAIAESLADAELFGHRRGAFTGAVASRPGAFEQAHQGTLFLDEIAELSPAVQVKLLRVIEEMAIRPVGGGQPLRVDVRILSATWASLPDRIALGKFREDLFHRIATLVVELPPLRERLSDISPLATTLLARLEDQVGPKQLSSAALGVLTAYPWPGNVRELGSVLLRAAVAAPKTHIDARHVQDALPRLRPCGGREVTARDAGRILADHRGNISAASRAAGVPRSTFRAWLKRPLCGDFDAGSEGSDDGQALQTRRGDRYQVRR